MDLSIGTGASSVGSDMNGATLFRVSGRAGLTFLSMRMRGGADLVEAVVELAVDGREKEALVSVVVMIGGPLGVLEDEDAFDGRRDEVGREGGC